jgi:ring-1,2-phenylacetyl-CoA epoxidase subunit PaaD
VGRVHPGPPRRDGTAVAAAPLHREAVLDALDEVMDPEIPTVSIVQLGMIGEVEIGADEAGRIRVELLPTFVGCPALELIQQQIAERLESFGRPVDVAVSFATPWTSDRISPEGREALRRSGFAPPPWIEAASTWGARATGRSLPVLSAAPTLDGGPVVGEATPCPYCGSSRTTLVSPFGPTQCRTIHHCADCRQPFEGFKDV